MRAMIKMLVLGVALLVVVGCEKTVKEGVNMKDAPSELASVK